MTSIAGVDIGRGHPCRIVAEMSNAHNGSLDRALRIIDAVHEAGTDFIKFQCYTPDELVLLRGDGPAPEPWGSQGWSMHDLYTHAQTPHAWFPTLIEKCEGIGLPWFASVFGHESGGIMDSLGCPAFKIASLDRTSDFARWAAACRQEGTIGPLIMSTPEPHREPWADLTLYCPPGYPQTWGPGERFYPKAHDGISYHGPFADTLVMMVQGFAPQMVEVHVQLDDEPSELEANVSLTMSDLAKLCEAVRLVPHG